MARGGHARPALSLLFVAVLAGNASAEGGCGDPQVGALRVVDAYLETFNERDAAAHAATLQYPSFRIDAAGDLVVLESAAEYASVFAAHRNDFPWDRSLYDSREILQAGARKVHVAVRFSRYRADGEKVSSHDSLYIVTCREGRWGIVARSSYVPVMRLPGSPGAGR